MKVAALYDLHGNTPALEAVLAAVRQEEVDEIVMGGDLVPGPDPEGCASLLRGLSTPVRSILGNGDRDVLEVQAGGTPERVPVPFLEVVRWSAGQLSQASLGEMAQWPPTLELDIPGLGPVVFCHATPRDDNEIFTRVTPDQALEPVFADVGSELVVCGHTHMQFIRQVGAVQVVNAGSVGLPFGAPGAFWAVLSPEGVSLRRTFYDMDAARVRLAQGGYPGDFEIRNPPIETEMLQLFEAAAIR